MSSYLYGLMSNLLVVPCGETKNFLLLVFYHFSILAMFDYFSTLYKSFLLRKKVLKHSIHCFYKAAHQNQSIIAQDLFLKCHGI